MPEVKLVITLKNLFDTLDLNMVREPKNQVALIGKSPAFQEVYVAVKKASSDHLSVTRYIGFRWLYDVRAQEILDMGKVLVEYLLDGRKFDDGWLRDAGRISRHTSSYLPYRAFAKSLTNLLLGIEKGDLATHMRQPGEEDSVVANLTARLTELTTEYQQLEADHKEMRSKLEETTEQRDALAAENKNSMDEVALLSKQHEIRVAQVSSMQDRAERAEKEVVQLQKEVRSLMSKGDEVVGINHVLAGSLSTNEQSLADARAKIDELLLKTVDLQEELKVAKQNSPRSASSLDDEQFSDARTSATGSGGSQSLSHSPEKSEHELKRSRSAGRERRPNPLAPLGRLRTSSLSLSSEGDLAAAVAASSLYRSEPSNPGSARVTSGSADSKLG